MLPLSAASEVDPLNGVRVTQSLIGICIPIVFGTDRVPGLLVWYGDYKSTQHYPPGGKGFGGKGANIYTYNASWISLLCSGPINGINSMWDQSGQYQPQGGQESFTVLAQPGAPALSETPGGTGAGGPVYVQITAVANGMESAASPEATFTTSADNYLVVASIAGITGATGYNVYIGTASGQEVLINTSPIPVGTNYTWTTEGQPAVFTVKPKPLPTWHPPLATLGMQFPRTGSFGADMGATKGNSIMSRQVYTSTSFPTNLPSGTYGTDNNGGYAFSSSDVGAVIQITYTYYYSNRVTTELYIVPSSQQITVAQSGQVYVEDTSGAQNLVNIYQNDLGVDYYPNGSPFTNVGDINPTVTGTYHEDTSSGGSGTYYFAPGDIGNEVVIKYSYYDQNNDPWAPANLSVTFEAGAIGQPTWSYLESNHPDQAVPYSEYAYAAWQNAYMGMSASIPISSYEVISNSAIGGGVLDATIPEALYSLLTEPTYAVNFPAANIDQNTWFTNADSAQNWIEATQLFFSQAIQNQQTVASICGRWMEAFQVSGYYSEGLFKLKPFGDQTATSTTAPIATYTPDLTIRAVLDDDSYLLNGKADDPIKVTRTPWADAYNRVQITYSSRINSYNSDIVYEEDEASIERFGLRIEPPQDFPFIKTWEIAGGVANMRLKRSVLIRNSYTFKLPLNYEYLEPMDLVSVSDSILGLDNLVVRLTRVENDMKHGLSCTAEDFPGNGYAMPVINPKANTPWLHPFQGTALPGNTTFFALEIQSSDTTQNSRKFYLYASSDNPNWGGADIYMSLDGTTYSHIANVLTPARIGTLLADLPTIAASPSGPLNLTYDSVDTLSITLAQTPAVVNTTGTAAWSPDISYALETFVVYDNLLWVAIAPNQGSVPTLSNPNWQQVTAATAQESPLLSVSTTVAENLGTVGALMVTVSSTLSTPPEFLSYTNVAPGAQTNQYALTDLYRGAFGSTIREHFSGEIFLRLQDASATYNLPTNVNVTKIYFRCVGRNTVGSSNQSVDNADTIEFKVGFNQSSAAPGQGTSSVYLAQQGSILANGAGIAGASWEMTTTSANVATAYWSYPAFFYPTTFGNFGQSTIPAGSTTAFTGLVGSTTYYASVYLDLATLQVVAVLSDAGSPAGTQPPSANQVQTVIQTDQHAPIVIGQAFTTPVAPSSGSSSGTGAGGGGATCFSPQTRVRVRRNGYLLDLPIVKVRTGDEVLTKTGKWRRVAFVTERRWDGMMVRIEGNELSTPTHQVWTGKGWADAESVWPQTVEYHGTIHNLHVDVEEEDDHSYTLSCGRVVHNFLTSVV